MAMVRKAIWIHAAIGMLLMAFTGIGLAARGDVLISLDFEDGLSNTGMWGGEAVVVEYAKGEGPVLSPNMGIGGSAALDFTRASRSGGLESDPAGGLLVLSHPRNDYPQQFTISMWFKATDPRGFERLLDPSTSSKPRLDVYLQLKKTLVLETRHIHGEPRYSGTTEILGDKWYFVAVVVDNEKLTKTIYLGGQQDREFAKEIEFEHPEPVVMSHQFRVGNIDEIRPFKGYVDLIELREGALNHEEVKALWAKGQKLLSR